MSISEFIYGAVKDRMELNKITDSQSQFFSLFELAFKKTFDIYFKQMMVVLNRIEFNSRWILKQNDIFMQHLKIPQTMEELNFSIIDHPITTKAQELVLKDIRKLASKKKELEDANN